MALNSSDVVAGDDILASHHNFLIDDIEQHIHEGIDTTKVKVEDIDVSTGDLGADSVPATALKTNSVETIKINGSAVTEAKINTGAVTVNKLGSSAVTTIKINGSAVTEAKINNGAVTVNKLDSNAVTTIKINNDAVTPAKLDDDADFTMRKLLASQGLAPGGNEYLMWDVILITLDGTSPDTAGYTIDELKVHGIQSSGHWAAAAVTMGHYNTAISTYAKVSIVSNTLDIVYGGSYGSGATLQVLIHYIA